MKAEYKTVKILREFIYIVDLNNGAMSVTNDAEAVVKDVLRWNGPNYRIIYSDTEDRWDELVHNGKEFTGFKPYKGWTPDMGPSA